jgi:probable phosphoglycerate mutase
MPWKDHREYADSEVRTEARIEVTEDIREWDYGDYEGKTSAQIREERKKKGEGSWDIWRDGCPGGEYVNPQCIIISCDGLCTDYVSFVDPLSRCLRGLIN